MRALPTLSWVLGEGLGHQVITKGHQLCDPSLALQLPGLLISEFPGNYEK